MLDVALPAIRADLGLSTGMLSGVVSAYVLGYGGFMLLGGRVADVLGRRRMFLFWLAVFLVFSGLGGFATEGWMLLVARFVTGVAAAFMAPAGLALVTGNFPEGPQRTKALGCVRRDRRGRVLARPGRRRAAGLDRLALGVLRAGAAVGADPRGGGAPHQGDRPVAARHRRRSTWRARSAITGAMLLLVYGVDPRWSIPATAWPARC